MGKKNFSYEIQYTRAADKFFAIHEDIRNEYEDAVKELLRERAWDLFHFKPGYISNPPKSKYYKRVTWRQI